MENRIDKERDFCVQLMGRRILFVHRMDRLEVALGLGDEVNVAYRLGVGKASLQHN